MSDDGPSIQGVTCEDTTGSTGCTIFVDLGVVTRLADALNGGVANVATKHAVEALHHLAVQLPTCRDLILATTALDTLVLLLKQSLANAHYSMLKEVIWTLLCLADDDPLCKAAIRLSANNSSKHDKAYWQRTAVHHLARLLRSTEGVLHGYSKQRLHAPPRLSSLNSSQKIRFLAKRNLGKDIAAAADEALIRVLESGPNSLETVKEAAGALKALIAGNTKLRGRGAVTLCQDVLMLASKVGPKGGLVGAGADLVRSMSGGNLPAQRAFGVAGCLGQLLMLLQDVSGAEADSEHMNNTMTRLVWALHALINTNRANQLSFQAAGGIHLLIQLLVQVSSDSPSQGSMFALGSLVKGNTDIQSEVELQGGIQMLVAYLGGDEAYIEGAAWALHSVVALHPANQGAARQAGVLPPVVGLLDFGPDSTTAECAARCLHALVQGSLPNQDAACSAGALMPLLDLAAAGPHQLAAKSAALAISALVCNHTANQDAVRQADGLPPLVALLRGGPRNEAAACAAGALANLVANNGINQDAAADAAAVEEVVTLLSAALADSACDRASIEAMKALAALTDGSLPNQDRALQAGAPALLCTAAQAAMQSGPATDAEIAWQLCKALACLTDEHPAVQQACGSAIAPLVALLSHPDTPVQDEACQALAYLVCDCPQHQMAAGQAGAVLTLMNLLCDLGGNADTDSMQRPIQVVHLLLALLVVATQVPDVSVLETSDGVIGGNSAILDMSPQQKFGIVSAFAQRPSQEPLILALVVPHCIAPPLLVQLVGR
ncbi:hypothetical protein WJX82_003853 [Trebouxia sp. C0006]